MKKELQSRVEIVSLSGHKHGKITYNRYSIKDDSLFLYVNNEIAAIIPFKHFIIAFIYE
jgi:hypothetical protein